MSTARARAYLALLATSIIWGVAGPVIKTTLTHVHPMTFLMWRFLIVAPVTIPWYWWYLKRHPVRPEDMITLTVLGFLGAVLHLSFIFLGFERTSALEGSLISATHPFFIVLIGYWFLKEKITRHELKGISLITIGVAIVTIHPLLYGNGFALQHVLGNMFIIVSGIILAVYTLICKRHDNRLTPIHITLHGSLIAVVSYIPLALYENAGRFPSPSLVLNQPAALAGILFMAYFSYLAAYVLFAYGMSRIEISEGSLFQYLSPLFGMPFAVAWLGESITTVFLVSTAFITAGVIVSEWRRL